MELKNQICSLRQALRLENLGVNAPSLFYYVSDDGEKFEPAYEGSYEWTEYPGYMTYRHIYPAYTLAELIAALPVNSPIRSNATDAADLLIEKIEEGWIIANDVNNQIKNS